jgi:hypothetical protein
MRILLRRFHISGFSFLFCGLVCGVMSLTGCGSTNGGASGPGTSKANGTAARHALTAEQVYARLQLHQYYLSE